MNLKQIKKVLKKKQICIFPFPSCSPCLHPFSLRSRETVNFSRMTIWKLAILVAQNGWWRKSEKYQRYSLISSNSLTLTPAFLSEFFTWSEWKVLLVNGFWEIPNNFGEFWPFNFVGEIDRPIFRRMPCAGNFLKSYSELQEFRPSKT